MTIKNDEVKKEQVDESAAADTLKANSRPSGDESKSRLATIQAMLGKFAEVDNTTLQHLYTGMIAQIGGEGSRAGLDGKAGANKNSLNMKPSDAVGKIQREELQDLFSGQDLSEEFIDKASTLFETAVNVRVMQEVERLEEQFGLALDESTKESVEDILETLDVYLDDAVEKWLEENQVAVISALESRMAKEFLEGIVELLKSHNVRVADDEYEVAEELVQANEALEQALDEKIKRVAELEAIIAEAELSAAAEKVLEGLNDTQAAEVKKLLETVEADDVEEFVKKANIIKEHFVESAKSGIRKPSLDDSFVTEETSSQEEEPADERVAQYAKMMKRTVRS